MRLESGSAMILAGLMITLIVFCSVSVAQDQGQALIEAAKKGGAAISVMSDSSKNE